MFNQVLFDQVAALLHDDREVSPIAPGGTAYFGVLEYQGNEWFQQVMDLVGQMHATLPTTDGYREYCDHTVSAMLRGRLQKDAVLATIKLSFERVKNKGAATAERELYLEIGSKTPRLCEIGEDRVSKHILWGEEICSQYPEYSDDTEIEELMKRYWGFYINNN